jgi:hypothetical protein
MTGISRKDGREEHKGEQGRPGRRTGKNRKEDREE